MYQFPAEKKTITAKLAAFFQRLKKIARSLEINGTKTTQENVFSNNHFTLESEKG